jgi:hypothetical protein
MHIFLRIRLGLTEIGTLSVFRSILEVLDSVRLGYTMYKGHCDGVALRYHIHFADKSCEYTKSQQKWRHRPRTHCHGLTLGLSQLPYVTLSCIA